MKPERFQQVETIFQAVLKRDPESRASFLDGACLDDEELRSEVESLLAAHDKAGSFIHTPAVEVAAELMADEQTDCLTNQTLGQYKIISKIGAGGMGEVYLAQDSKLGRKVALKLLPDYFTSDNNRLIRFKQEARAASALNHPNIITIFGIGQMESTHFIATEFIEGQTLRQIIANHSLKLTEALDVVIQTASALAAAHQAGIVHRDIKPENIMMRPDGYVKVLDFGLAKLTEGETLTTSTDSPTRLNVSTSPGMVMGTASYMSPEQARGQRVDARTDIWSLGVVLYEMVTNHSPFKGETTIDVISAIVERQPAPLARFAADVPAQLQWIVSKALRKERDERYQTIKEMVSDLKDLRHELEVQARTEGSWRSESSGESGDAEAATTAGRQRLVATTTQDIAIKTADAAAQNTSSTEVILGEMKKHKAGTIITLIALAIALGVVIYLWRASDKVAPTAIGIKSMLVLPFKPLTTGERNDPLELGMADALITKLTNIRELVVRPTSTILKYHDAEQDPLAAGREQQVDAVLEGKVQRADDRIRITIQLVRVADGKTLWADRFDEKDTNIFSLQDSISQQVAQALVSKLTHEEQQQLTKRYTNNTEAYNLYLKGRFFWNKFNEDGLKKSIEYYNQALATDPNYALAYTGLASSYGVQGSIGLVPQIEACTKLRWAVEQAIKLDDTLADAHTTLGAVKMFCEWDWQGAEHELKRALELNPNNEEAHNLYSYYLQATGQVDKGIAEIRRAQELAPLSPIINKDVAVALYRQGHYDEALEASRKAREIDPDYILNKVLPAQIYERKGAYDQAIAECQKAFPVVERRHVLLSVLGYVYAVSGKRQEARNLLGELETMWKQHYFPPSNIALVYTGLGDRDGAFLWLAKAYEAHDIDLLWLNIEPQFESLRADPRFEDLLRRMGLQP